MILYRWQGGSANFGDELNTVLWPRLLPGLFDDDPAARFMGIGSVLDARHPQDALKLVAGSGYGGYERKPDLDRSWIMHWVRGPRTAAVLGLDPELGLGDPAVLVPPVLGIPPGRRRDIGFVPHFESAARGAWQQAADQAGLRLIDPREPPLAVLAAMAGCKLILSEALHGVIAADAMRIPWIAIRPRATVHRAKWCDWSATVRLSPRFHGLPASTLAEWAGASRLSAFHAGRTWLASHARPLAEINTERLVARASDALRRVAGAWPQLSADSDLDRCQSRMLAAVEALRRHPLAGTSHAKPARPARWRLRETPDSAYELPVPG